LGLSLICQNCDTQYPVLNNIPSLIDGGVAEQDWNAWDSPDVEKMGDSYYRRSIGELPEKESSKSFANILKDRNLYESGDSILDIGCATGHFYRSFRNRLDKSVKYTGIDATLPFLQLGDKVFGTGGNCDFVHCDALVLPFKDKSYDIVVVNLFQFFPRLDYVLKESMRVSKKMVLWRTPIGHLNYAIKIYHENDFSETGVLTPERNDIEHTFTMIYTKQYIHDIVRSLGGKVRFDQQDTDFQEFDNSVLKGFDYGGTKVVNGMQIDGSMVLDWHTINNLGTAIVKSLQYRIIKFLKICILLIKPHLPAKTPNNIMNILLSINHGERVFNIITFRCEHASFTKIIFMINLYRIIQMTNGRSPQHHLL
jgi:ubiquinone/menaquinone biosynthesis C-methylase UbiE